MVSFRSDYRLQHPLHPPHQTLLKLLHAALLLLQSPALNDIHGSPSIAGFFGLFLSALKVVIQLVEISLPFDHGPDEEPVVGNQHNGSVEGGESGYQGRNGVEVQMGADLVQDEELWRAPHKPG